MAEVDSKDWPEDRKVTSSRQSTKASEKLDLEDAKILDDNGRSKAERQLVRKLDMRLLPMIFLIFIMNYVDRTAISSARLKGLEQDLRLTDLQYQTVIAILYASYCPASIPSNMIINRVSKPSLYIGVCVVLWGLTSALTGITQNYAGMLACRFFLGLPEATFYPGAIFLLTRWYTRKELAIRSTFLYGGLIIANAFGSLMAAGILSNMEGKQGIRAWRWLFFIFGAITVVLGIASIWILPDFPHNTHSLSAAERRLAQARLAEDTGEADSDQPEDSAWSGLRQAITDPNVLLFSLMTFSLLLGSSYVNFFPSITATLGFSTTTTLLLGAPPWIWATVVACANAWHADRSGERFFHLTVPWCTSIVGYIIALSTTSIGSRYFALFLMTTGYAGSTLALVWVANTIHRPPAKRAAAIGVVNGLGNLGILAGSYVWKIEWAPHYRQSMAIGIAALVCSCVFAFAIRTMLLTKNKQFDRDDLGGLRDANQERVEEAARLEGITLKDALEKKRAFRYLY